LLATLGVSILFLANSENWKGRLSTFFSVFGRVPFFYYVVHIYLIRILASIAAELTGFGWEMMIQNTIEIQLGNYGFGLPVVYMVWIGIILVLYPLCRWYDNYKMNNREKWWLSYL
jgi:predicted acyltransferase